MKYNKKPSKSTEMNRNEELIERHRDALEALAEHGQTELADDARILLDQMGGDSTT